MSNKLSPGDLHSVIFSLAGEEYAVPIRSVREVLRLQPIGRVPGVPDHVTGVINVRGQVMPVIDARSLIGLVRTEPSHSARILVIEAGKRMTGLLVDAVTQVAHIPENSLTSGEDKIGITVDFVQGISQWEDRLIILLDLDSAVRTKAA